MSRLSIDRLASARARREVYPGTWLPEPVITEEPVDAVGAIMIPAAVIHTRLREPRNVAVNIVPLAACVFVALGRA